MLTRGRHVAQLERSPPALNLSAPTHEGISADLAGREIAYLGDEMLVATDTKSGAYAFHLLGRQAERFRIRRSVAQLRLRVWGGRRDGVT